MSTFIKRYFYVLLGILALAIVHIGFAKTYVAPVLNGAFTGRKILHVHGAIFMAWVVLCIVQPFLVQKKRTDLHKKIGVAGFVLAGLVVLMGLYIAVTASQNIMARDGEHAGRAIFLIPFSDMVLFALFVTFAIRNIRNSEAHKRYIILATLSLLPAATGRMMSSFTWWTGNIVADTMLSLLVMELTLYLAIIYDAVVKRQIHTVYIWGGLLILFIHAFRDWASNTDIWQSISGWMIG